MERTRLALIYVLLSLPLARLQSSSLVCIKSTDDKSGQVCAYQLNTEETIRAINDLKGELNSLRLKVEALQTNNSANLTAAILRGYMELDGGWIAPFNGYQYKAVLSTQSWSASRTICQQWGGDLAQYGVRDVATRITLHRGLSLSGSHNHWIGLSDAANEGTWVWLNGNRANPDDGSLWSPGNYPTTSATQDCAIAYFSDTNGSGSFVWDIPCSHSYRALCEKEV